MPPARTWGEQMAMDFLTIHSTPELRSPAMVTAFQGWPDAGEVASGALRYLVCNLGATRFAEITPEEFYVFTEVRPHSVQVRPGQRTLRWPSNDFYYWNNPDGGIFLWVTLHKDVDDKKLYQYSEEEGVAYRPGSAFNSDGGGKGFLRLAYSFQDVETIEEGIKRLGAAMHRAAD